jgi:Domain of unknown function (DUF5916)/Carbohydrate family 9 binding domain-like
VLGEVPLKQVAGLAVILCLGGAAAAQEPPRKSVGAFRTGEPPVLDGRLDDAVWQQAPFVEDLHVVVSNEFGRPGERSRVYLAYDDDNLYFAARFWDREPERVVAKVLRKGDVSFGEDGFTITLDPYDQGRSGYQFDVNPNGMRSEAIFIDVDRQNWDWEGIWDAAARRDGEGWTAEVAIPAKTLSFDPARDAWGINFTRWLGRDNEQFGWVSFNRTQDLARTGALTGLSGLQQGRGLDLVPGIRFVASRDYEAGAEDSELEPSLDAFWKLTPSLVAALTVNPDFAGTTADARQINLTRFDIFFPEQRAFFLQDSDIFEFGRLEAENGRPFFSRRIGLDDDGETLRLDAGLKMTGRAGPWNVGILGVRQDSATGLDSEDLFVGRMTTNVLAESVVGAIVTSGSPDGIDNALAGLDFRYLNTRLGEGRLFQATAWVQNTSTEGLEGDDMAVGVNLAAPNSVGWAGEVGFKRLEEHYLPGLGFANRTNIHEYAADLGYTWRPESGPFRAIETGIEGTYVEQIVGAERSQEIELALVELENQTADFIEISHYFFEERLVEPFEISDGVVIPAGTYAFDHACATLNSGEHRVLMTQTTLCDGEFYDGRIFSAVSFVIWRPSAHLKVGIGGEYNDVNLPQGDFITRLLQLNLDVAFNVAWSWENFIQYDNVSETVGVNSILRFIPRAGREMVLAANSLQEDFDGDRRFQSYSSDVTFKLSYTFRF